MPVLTAEEAYKVALNEIRGRLYLAEDVIASDAQRAIATRATW